ncbi:hypothetical protein [Actinomadura harenae]|uniref:Uncharacterized protein n=1 Tax=Actinomadura harenae TaxID=2483351 RepID=A0A3M2LRZ0_9ACTN|nr:hypothetical protein [Actinomadura harenae]RMI40219.1 hypothetical protein EBO15_27365 [Actinomadura harenae]
MRAREEGTAGTAGTAGRTERAAFRAWVRDHHPDLGGDPEAFAAGLRRRRRVRTGGGPSPDAPIVGVPRRFGPVAVVERWRYRRSRARRLR